LTELPYFIETKNEKKIILSELTWGKEYKPEGKKIENQIFYDKLVGLV